MSFRTNVKGSRERVLLAINIVSTLHLVGHATGRLERGIFRFPNFPNSGRRCSRPANSKCPRSFWKPSAQKRVSEAQSDATRPRRALGPR